MENNFPFFIRFFLLNFYIYDYGERRGLICRFCIPGQLYDSGPVIMTAYFPTQNAFFRQNPSKCLLSVGKHGSHYNDTFLRAGVFFYYKSRKRFPRKKMSGIEMM